MNFQEIHSPEVQRFIKENLGTPVDELLLRARKYSGLNIPLVVAQIEGLNKAKKKLPAWYNLENIIYPIKLSMEQCSSEITAAYKASLLSGNTLIDLTGGFGVDCAAFAEKMSKVIYVERNTELAEIAKHNFTLLKRNNIEVRNEHSEDFIKEYKNVADWTYIDPARRKEGSKAVRFADCEPNVLELQQSLFKISPAILIKTSPLLDIHQAVKELGYVKEVHVLSVDNECKELLFIQHKEFGGNEPEIVAVNIRKENIQDEFRFNRKKESEATIQLSFPKNYLYEPNASILKAGAFKSIAVARGLYKLNASSHLYTSEELQQNFPGRIFCVLKILKYAKKEILSELPEGKANITTRNFPDTVEEIRKKTGLKEGGSRYLFATKDLNEKPIVLLTEKII